MNRSPPARSKAKAVTLSQMGPLSSLGPSSGFFFHARDFSQVANFNFSTQSWVKCDANGDIYITRDTTFSGVFVWALGVQLR